MDWSIFLRGLFEHGRLALPSLTPLSPSDLTALGEQLAPYEALHRAELPANSPPWDVAAGTWAGAMLFRACQFLIYREHGPEVLDLQLGGDPPEPSPAAHYSIDLTFQYLGDVIAYGRSASEEDPLVKRLEQWAGQWPLSSVGVPRVEPAPERVQQLSESPALWTMYVDRIIARDDLSRLEHPLVISAVEAVLGDHPNLASPQLLRKIEQSSNR